MHLTFLNSDDASAIHRLFCEPEVYRYLADGQVPDASIASQWISEGEHDRNSGGGLWGLKDPGAPETLAGIVRLSDFTHASLELTYLLHPAYWRQGLATRMAHTVMDSAFRTDGVDTIWAGADEPNIASIAVMQRLGMTFRNYADYPAGRGLEYSLNQAAFDRSRHTSIPVG